MAHRSGLFGLGAHEIMFAAFGLLLGLLPPLVEYGLRRAGRVEPNFRGERIPQSYGLVVLLWSGLMLAGAAFVFPRSRSVMLLWLTGVIGYGLLGLADDVWGVKHIKGLRGHFRAAWRERVITTGFIKAVAGAFLALTLGYRLSSANPWLAVVNAALIALSANAVNLLDLRPGRASGVFLLLTLPLAAYALLRNAPDASPLPLVVVPALLVWLRDGRAQVMMGDAGSNLLGASLGLALCAAWMPVWVRLLALACLIGLHILAERASLTQIIAASPFLRALDRLTGVR